MPDDVNVAPVGAGEGTPAFLRPQSRRGAKPCHLLRLAV